MKQIVLAATLLVLASASSAHARPIRAYRVTIAYDGRSFELVSARPVVKTIPSSDSLTSEEAARNPTAGFWYEVEAGGQRQVIYRRTVEDPLDRLEYFDEHGQPFRGKDPVSFGQRRLFSVLVPAVEDGNLCMHRSNDLPAPNSNSSRARETELVRFQLPSPAAQDWAPAGEGATGGGLRAVKVHDSGPDDQRFNLVVVSEGFRSEDLRDFADATNRMLRGFFALSPLNEYSDAINVWRVEMPSQECGVDDPAACGGSGTHVATRFDGSLCNNGIRRLLVVNDYLVLAVVDGLVPAWDAIVVLANSSLHGGSGGPVAAISVGSYEWERTLVHELGHSVFGLADEYDYYFGCDDANDAHPPLEPVQPNVTINADRETAKWADLIEDSTPIPTLDNQVCSQCNLAGSPFPAETVGLFEGANFFHCGAFRPQFHCMMRDVTEFCAVCARRIQEVLSPYAPSRRAPALLDESQLSRRGAERACVGTCECASEVRVDNLVSGIGMVLGTADVAICPTFDRDEDGRVTIDELITAVDNALFGCSR